MSEDHSIEMYLRKLVVIDGAHFFQAAEFIYHRFIEPPKFVGAFYRYLLRNFFNCLSATLS